MLHLTTVPWNLLLGPFQQFCSSNRVLSSPRSSLYSSSVVLHLRTSTPRAPLFSPKGGQNNSTPLLGLRAQQRRFATSSRIIECVGVGRRGRGSRGLESRFRESEFESVRDRTGREFVRGSLHSERIPAASFMERTRHAIRFMIMQHWALYL